MSKRNSFLMSFSGEQLNIDDRTKMLLEKGARIDLFCAAMMGQLEAVKSFLTLSPKLIDAKGPHGFSLHWHAKVGGKEAEKVLEHLQSIKKVDFTPRKK